MALFEMGQVVQTSGITDRRNENGCFDFMCDLALRMHSEGNWGDVCDEDWESNQEALRCGDRIFSSYWLDSAHTEKIWIITEADRSVTTILFPEEY